MVQCSWFTVHDSQFTIHSSQFTVHDSQIAVHDSQSTVHISQFMGSIPGRDIPTSLKMLLAALKFSG